MPKNVLVFPAGTEIGLEIYKALRYSKDFLVFGSSSEDSNHARFLFDNYIEKLPFINEKKYFSYLNEVIKKYKIDFIYPAHDEVLLRLSQCQNKINAKVIASEYKICKLCRSKKATYNFLKDKVKVPKIFNDIDKVNFPVFLKPDKSQGSRGTYKANNKQEANFFLKKDPSLLILEYLPGKEYTVDCFTDYKGRLRFIGARERIRIDRGISVNSKPFKSKKIKDVANIINNNLNLCGAWFFQLKKGNLGKFKLLEIGPRIAGTMTLYRHLGINFPLLSLYNIMGKNTELILNNYKIELDRPLASYFKTNITYENVYIDWDDCLFIKGKLNTQLMALIFQCHNESKNVFILSRSNDNVISLTKKLKIYSLFKKVIIIKNSEKKSDYIKSKNSIFIDDSFSERYDVHNSLKIPVFDLDTIDLLLK